MTQQAVFYLNAVYVEKIHQFTAFQAYLQALAAGFFDFLLTTRLIVFTAV